MGRRTFKAAFCGFLILAWAQPALALNATSLHKQLAHQDRIMGSAAGALVVDLDTGQTLFSSRPTLALAPASNEKLLVTSTALLRLGPGSTMKTRLLAEQGPLDGTVHGDVALVGGGDPFLGGAGLATLAQDISDLGVSHITGRVLGDASLLDSRVGSFDSGWGFDPDLGGRLAALVVDGGRGTDPVLYAAQQMHAALRHDHIKLGARPRRGRLAGSPTPLASVSSARLGTIVAQINAPSDNFAAELLLKDIGAFAGTGGTTAAGAAVVGSTMSRLGVHATVYDGSGLSRADRVSPSAVVRLLTQMAGRPQGAALADSLAIAGQTGTLVHRMRGTPARGRCRAKTGTLIGVSALSGYCTTTAGARVVFSFIENRVCASCAKKIEDRMTAAIARYSPSAPAPAPAPSSDGGSESGGSPASR